MEFDYKKLLIAYMKHVAEAEGTDFVGNTPWVLPMDSLTLIETQELNHLSGLANYKEINE